MEISKKKKSEFNNIFRLEDNNKFIIDIDLFRKIFLSDFYENFIIYTETRIIELLKNFEEFNIQVDTSTFTANDLLEYNNILIFSKMLHKYGMNLKNIYIYNSSYLVMNLINLLNTSLNIDSIQKIIFMPNT